MKLLTATQGDRPGDFTCAVEGELVYVGPMCSIDERDPLGGGCGCGRSFSGFGSKHVTTTALVRDLPFTRDDLRMVLFGTTDDPPDEIADEIAEEVEQLVRAGAAWPVGTVVERCGDVLSARAASDDPAA